MILRSLPFLALLLGSQSCFVPSVESNPNDQVANQPAVKDPNDAAPPETQTQSQTTTTSNPAIRFVGRFDTTDINNPRMSWAGVSISAHFSGTSSVRTTLTEEGNSQFDVIVDGGEPVLLVLNEGTNTYSMASGLSIGEHTITLYRRSEPNVGTTTFNGFDLMGGTLLSPPTLQSHSIEFLGDSISAGYGIGCLVPGQTETAYTQNEHLAHTGLMAEQLNADHQTIAYSGEGVYWNYDRTNQDVFGVIYPRVLGDNPALQWNFASWVPDVVWIDLGTNDWNAAVANAPAPLLSDFQNSYDALVSVVRGHYPTAMIFLAVAPDLNDGYPIGYSAYTNVKAALNNIVADRGDDKIAVFEFSRSTAADTTGCDGHPNASKQASMAVEGMVAVKKVMGW